MGSRQFCLSFVCAALLIACDKTPKSTTSWKRTTRVKILETEPKTRVGNTIVMDGHHALVSGRGHGQVYALEKFRDQWRFNHRLPSVSRVKKDHFGSRLILHGVWAAIGAPEHQSGDDVTEGAVHIYRRDAKGKWQHHQYLKGPDKVRHFGVGMAKHRDKLWVAANQSLFVYGETPKTQWALEHTIALPKSPSFEHIISNIAFAGDDLIIRTSAGTVDKRTTRLYVYRSNASNQWMLHQTLDAPFDGVFLSRGMVANQNTIAVPCDAGKHNTVLIYNKDPTGKWQQTSRVEPKVSQENTFGMQLLLRGNDLYISTTAHNGRILHGAIYNYRQRDGQYHLHETLTSVDGVNNFGRSFDIHGDDMLVGAYQLFESSGAQYVYLHRRSSKK